MDLLDWINGLSGVISLLITGVLVIITGIYVLLTNRISKTSSQNLTASIMRIVVIILKESSSTGIRKWVIQNIGNGPALNVIEEGLQESADAHNKEPMVNTGHFHKTTKYFDGGKGILSNQPGCEIIVFPDSAITETVYQPNIYFKEEWWNISFIYTDIYGNAYRTVYKNGIMDFSKIRS